MKIKPAELGQDFTDFIDKKAGTECTSMNQNRSQLNSTVAQQRLMSSRLYNINQYNWWIINSSMMMNMRLKWPAPLVGIHCVTVWVHLRTRIVSYDSIVLAPWPTHKSHLTSWARWHLRHIVYICSQLVLLFVSILLSPQLKVIKSDGYRKLFKKFFFIKCIKLLILKLLHCIDHATNYGTIAFKYWSQNSLCEQGVGSLL